MEKSIPKAYRPGVREGKGAIIAPPPAKAMLEAWLDGVARHIREARRSHESERRMRRLDGDYVWA